MKTEAMEIYDLLNGEWTREKAEDFWERLKKMAKWAAKAENEGTISEKVDVKVEKAVFKEVRGVATKEDIAVVKADLDGKIDKLDNKTDKLGSKLDSMFMWMVTGFIAILLGIIAILAVMVFSGNPAAQ